MKKRLIRNRKTRYGVLTAVLAVLVLTVVILANAVFGTLAKRYLWYTYMTADGTYEVTENCYTLLGQALNSAGEEPVEIIFCNLSEKLMEDTTERYVYVTATSLAERYPDRIKIRCYDIWTNPNTVKKYKQTLNPATGEMVDTTLKSTSVIISRGDYYRVYALTEFFIFKEGDTSKVWAYNGEKKLAAGILHAVGGDKQTVCLTNNHGEIFYDYELLYLLDDAGYSIRFINLYSEPIPDDCRLIISCNPNSDLTVADGISTVSESELLDNFLSKDGNALLVFLEDGTPALPNFEAYLEQWGVATRYYEDKASGTSYRYMVQDASQSLTSDGYTIYGEPVMTGHSAGLLTGLERKMIFKNATALAAANGFVNNGDGSYTKGNRTLYALYESGKNATSWANGAPVSGDAAMLMTMTEQKNTTGISRVCVVSSVDFMTEDYIQSAVYGNTDLLLHTFGTFGQSNTPEGLTIKPFGSKDISIITTAQMWRWTVWLTVIPAVTVTTAALLVLIRRRRS